MVSRTLRKARRVIIAAIGLTVLVLGITMIVLPGPAVVVIPVGLGILATEFVWAQRLLTHIKTRLAAMHKSMASSHQKTEESNEHHGLT